MSTVVKDLVVESSITVNGVDVTTNVANPEPAITAGTSADYYRGDKTFQVLDKTAVGLSNVDNTSDINKPISTDVQNALDDKVDKITGKGLSTNDFSDEYHADVILNRDIVNDLSNIGVVDGGVITLTGGVNFSISGGRGYTEDSNDHIIIAVSWNEIAGTCVYDGDNFIYLNNDGTLFFSPTKTYTEKLYLGYIATANANTVVIGFNSVKLPFIHSMALMGQFAELAVGCVVESGLELSTGIAPDQFTVTVSAGALWASYNRFDFTSPITSFTKLYYTSAEGYHVNSSNPNLLDNTRYNDISLPAIDSLVPLTTGYYKKDSVFLSSKGVLYVQYGTSQYATLDDVYLASVPEINPATRQLIAPIAHIITQEGNPDVIDIIDVRPNIKRVLSGEAFTSVIRSIPHHELNGISHDDHLQYHTDSRGDARYYRKSDLDAGQLDNRYYTESEITTFLSGKSNTGHTHVAANITDLSKNSIGLNNVQNVDQTNASNLTNGTVANARLTTNLTEIGNASFTEGDLVGHSGGVLTSRSVSQVRTTLSINNVDNTSDINKPISTDVQNALDDKVDKITGKGLSTNDFSDVYQSNVEFADSFASETGSSVNTSGGVITLTGGVNFSISPGVGYTRDNTSKLVRVDWGALSGSCTNDGDNFINIDYQGNVTLTTFAAQGDLIALGYIRTAFGNTTVVGFSNTRLKGYNHLFNLGELFRSSIGSLVQSGCNTAMQASPNELKLTVGSGFIWSLFNRFTITDASAFTKLFNTTDYGFIPDTVTTANTVNTAYWNNTSNDHTTALVPLTAGYYKKDMVVLTPEGSVLYVYGNSEWATIDDARTAPTPAVPEELSVVRSAAIVVQQGATAVSELVDIRPMFSRIFDTGAAAVNATVVSHSNLVDLNNDDHLQYFNSTRGDARYYRKTELDSGALDTRYYTESEITTFLSGKANSSHTHVAANITDLSKTSVGLGNVQNVDQTNASNLTSGTVNPARLSENLEQIAGLVKTEGDLIAVVGGVFATQPVAGRRAVLGIDQVPNVDTTNASNITSGTLANARLSSNLKDIGNLSFNEGDFIRYNTGVVTNLSASGVKSALSLTKTDVGLNNVQNVDTTNASNITSGTLADARLTSNLSQLGGITFSTNDYIQFNGTTLVRVTPAQVKSSLSLTKSDVGLGNVANIDLSNVANSLQVINAGGAVSHASGTNASKPTVGTSGRFYSSTDQGITYFDNGTTWAAQLPAYTGDVTSALGGTALTLATVNSNIGTFNNVTVNAKGLVTAASNVSYLTGNQSITVSGDATGSGTTGIAVTLATVNSNVGTFNNVTVNAKGLVTAASNTAYLTANQTITLSGDITGSGTTGIAGTLATVNSNVGSFGSTSAVPVITVNAKGLVTAVSTAALTSSSVGLGNVTNSLQVINAGGAVSYALGLNSAKPAAGTSGRQYYSTDQGITYYDNGSTWAAELPAYTGDVTSSVGGSTLTLATVNSNIGTFNNVTVNGKGLVTAASNVSYLTANQTITLSGDFTGSGTTGITGTLATVNSNVGTFNTLTVNAKGLVTAASNTNYLGDSGANGVIVRTALNTTTNRSIAGTANQVSVTNGDGVAGNPTVAIADNPVLPGTGSMTLPAGTTAQRDSAAVNGKLRWNSDLLQVEVSDTNVYRILGKVTQFITGNIAQTTGTTILPYDATLPQSTEGFQIWTANITPLYNNSTIVVIFNIFTEVSTANNTMSVALFNGTTAIATNSGYTGVANTATNLSIIKSFTPGTTSTITLSARSGPSVASTMYVNRGNTETLSGAPNTSYIIMEII